MGYQVDLARYRLYLTLLCLMVPVVFVAWGLKGCEVRHGSEKTACDKGDLAKCLEAAKAYDPDDPNDIIAFLFDYAAVAKREYGKACELGSPMACYRFAEITRQGGGAFVGTSSDVDEKHGYTKACERGWSSACIKLYQEYGIVLDGGTENADGGT
ncbi:MAG: hypothetical protein QM723_33635 [Myxococcaceae bacterium]